MFTSGFDQILLWDWHSTDRRAGKKSCYQEKHFLTSLDDTFLKWDLLLLTRLFHCYMLEESIRHFRGVRSILWLLFLCS